MVMVVKGARRSLMSYLNERYKEACPNFQFGEPHVWIRDATRSLSWYCPYCKARAEAFDSGHMNHRSTQPGSPLPTDISP